MMRKIDFQVAFGAVKHFGRNLYTTNPPAIAELIANAWDAYATECHILHSDTSLLIYDNGIGMNNDEIINRYAISGFEKKTDNIRKPEELNKRPYMGKKGIGKFSAFSLGDEYSIYTKADIDEKWKKLTLNYNSIMENSNQPLVSIEMIELEDLSELKTAFSFTEPSTGTFIFIPNLRRKFTSATDSGIRNLIRRRFSVSISTNYDFTLYENNEKIDLRQHFYDSNLEFIYYFGLTNEEELQFKQRFKNTETLKKHSISSFLKNNDVKGWIGTVKTSSALNFDNNFNAAGIVVYVNGKLADENILKSIKDDRVANLYIVGEVDANFLQNNNEDPILSNREGLNLELSDVEELRNEIKQITNTIINAWNELRANRPVDKQDHLNRIFEDPVYEGYYKKLSDDEKKHFNNLSHKFFSKKEDYNDDSKLKIAVPRIFSFVNSSKIEQLSKEDKNITEDIFIEMFEKLEINEALVLKSNLDDRLKVIKKLQDAIDTEAVEKVFENHLRYHPWLINPYWDSLSKKDIIPQQRLYKNVSEEEKLIGIVDLLIHVKEEQYPVVVELKREKETNYSAPNVDSIISQVRKYRKGINNVLATKGKAVNDLKVIPAYFIIGSKSYKNLEATDHSEIKNYNITLLTYENLIHIALNTYKTAIDDSEIQ